MYMFVKRFLNGECKFSIEPAVGNSHVCDENQSIKLVQ